jgi:hypothetical protein
MRVNNLHYLDPAQRNEGLFGVVQYHGVEAGQDYHKQAGSSEVSVGITDQ